MTTTTTTTSPESHRRRARLLGRLALLVPFAVGPFFVRLAIDPVGEALAAAVITVAPLPPRAAPSSTSEPLDDEPSSASGARPEAHASRGNARSGRRVERRARKPAHERVEPTDEDPSRQPIAASRGTIVIGAGAVVKAVEARNVGASDAVGPDGRPAGARLHGVSRHRAGLRDGDVVVSVAGTPTPTRAALVDAATKALSGGATKLTGRIHRGDEAWDVVLEIPPR